jgi:hypothetical protein
MNLSKNFTLEELTASQTAARNGLDNTPTEDTLYRLVFLCAHLERVRAICGNNPVIITSGYRSPVVNARVGGSDGSAHMRGLAADLIVPRFGHAQMVAQAIAQSDLPFDQLILEFGSWVHLGVRIDKPRRQVLTATRDGGRVVYRTGLGG